MKSVKAVRRQSIETAQQKLLDAVHALKALGTSQEANKALALITDLLYQAAVEMETIR